MLLNLFEGKSLNRHTNLVCILRLGDICFGVISTRFAGEDLFESQKNRGVARVSILKPLEVQSGYFAFLSLVQCLTREVNLKSTDSHSLFPISASQALLMRLPSGLRSNC